MKIEDVFNLSFSQNLSSKKYCITFLGIIFRVCVCFTFLYVFIFLNKCSVLFNVNIGPCPRDYTKVKHVVDFNHIIRPEIIIWSIENFVNHTIFVCN